MSAARATLRVGNDRGVHGRVATRLAEIAMEHNASLRIDRDAHQRRFTLKCGQFAVERRQFGAHVVRRLATLLRLAFAAERFL